MAENIVNIFAYGDETHVHSIGWRTYMRDGSDEELLTFLRTKVSGDHETAMRQDIREPIKWEDFNSMNRLKATINTLTSNGIMSENDMYCITPIVNGMVKIDGIDDEFSPDQVPDYLTIYLTDDGFDFPNLIHDDYFRAIRMLWNEKKYISCLKLMFSAIDTFGFIEHGPHRNCFIRWLDDFCDLESIGVTSTELWELRNSMLHMTNLLSHKVRDGSIEQLMPTITSPENEVNPHLDGIKRFHTSRFLLEVLPKGIEKWFESYNQNRGKIIQFISRYDTIVSEARMSKRKA